MKWRLFSRYDRSFPCRQAVGQAQPNGAIITDIKRECSLPLFLLLNMKRCSLRPHLEPKFVSSTCKDPFGTIGSTKRKSPSATLLRLLFKCGTLLALLKKRLFQRIEYDCSALVPSVWISP